MTDSINLITDAISIALNGEFGDGYTLLETTETSVSGEFTFAVKATDAEQYAGEYTLNGTGDYEGWLILRRSFTLEHRNNPYWKCIELKDVPILNSEYVNVE